MLDAQLPSALPTWDQTVCLPLIEALTCLATGLILVSSRP